MIYNVPKNCYDSSYSNNIQQPKQAAGLFLLNPAEFPEFFLGGKKED